MLPNRALVMFAGFSLNVIQYKFCLQLYMENMAVKQGLDRVKCA